MNITSTTFAHNGVGVEFGKLTTGNRTLYVASINNGAATDMIWHSTDRADVVRSVFNQLTVGAASLIAILYSDGDSIAVYTSQCEEDGRYSVGLRHSDEGRYRDVISDIPRDLIPHAVARHLSSEGCIDYSNWSVLAYDQKLMEKIPGLFWVFKS